MEAAITLSPVNFDAVLFDLDGPFSTRAGDGVLTRSNAMFRTDNADCSFL
jgi:hypothetical protein